MPSFFKKSVLISAALTLSVAHVQATEPVVKLPGEINNFYDRIFVQTHMGEQAPEVTDLKSMAKELAAYDVVFFGEFHRHPGVHLAQMQLFQAMHEQNAHITLSLEQFETDTQPLVNAYLAGEIGETPFKKEARAWDNYLTSYRPLVIYARHNKLPVLAAEAPTPMVACVGKYGPDVLSMYKTERRKYVAEKLHIEPGAYQDKYFAFAGGHKPQAKNTTDVVKKPKKDHPNGHNSGTGTGHGGSANAVMNSYAAQVVRDDTMAQSIFDHLEKNPDQKILHLNGNFHSASFLGTPERLLKRNPNLKIAVINPVEVTDGTAPAVSDKDLESGTFVMLVHPSPQTFVKPEKQMEWFKSVMQKRQDKSSCDLNFKIKK